MCFEPRCQFKGEENPGEVVEARRPALALDEIKERLHFRHVMLEALNQFTPLRACQ